MFGLNFSIPKFRERETLKYITCTTKLYVEPSDELAVVGFARQPDQITVIFQEYVAPLCDVGLGIMAPLQTILNVG